MHTVHYTHSDVDNQKFDRPTAIVTNTQACAPYSHTEERHGPFTIKQNQQLQQRQQKRNI